MLYFNRFDILEAYMLFAHDYNGSSVEYRIQHRIAKLHCRFANERIETADDNVKSIYAGLVRRHYMTDVATGRFIRAANGRVKGDNGISLERFSYASVRGMIGHSVIACYK